MNSRTERRDLQIQISGLEEEISSIEAVIADLDLQIEYAKLEAEKINYQRERDRYYKELNERKPELERLRSQLATLKRFDRERCLKNVDMLLAQKNMKLGELEINSGNRPGYLSRMKSGKSNSDPSIEFLMTASDELDVPLDLLVGSSLADITPTEEFMLEFMRRLISDTNSDKLEWTRETMSELEQIEIIHDINGYAEVSHPLYRIGEKGTDTDKYECPVYNSLFFKNYGVRPCGNGYYTTLVPNDQRIYIMKCTMVEEKGPSQERQFFEIYMVEYDRYGNATTKKVCNTLEASSPLVATIDSMIKAITISISHVHIDDSVRSAIDAYMNGKRFADEGPDEELPFN